MLGSLKEPGRLGWLLLGATMAVATVFLLWLQRDLAHEGDSINWLALSGTSPAKALVEPYGGHLIFVPLTIFKGITIVAGTDYMAFGLVDVAMVLLLAGLVYVYGKRRVGPLLALPAPIALLFLGSSWTDLMQPLVGIQFLCGIVPGVAALLALERDDRRGDIAACALLTLGTWGFEMGLTFVVGAGVLVALRDDRRRRAWIVAVPAFTYLVWKAWALQYSESVLHPANLLWFPAYAVDSLGVVTVSLFGLFFLVGSGPLTSLKLIGFDLSNFSQGFVLLTLEALGVLFIVRRLRQRGPISASFCATVAMLLAVWGEQCLAMASNRTPGEIRYILPDTVFVLLFALEAARGIRTTRTTLVAAAAIALAMVVGNLPRFQEARHILTEFSPLSKASITVLELGGTHVPAEFVPAEDAAEAFPPARGAYVEAGTVQEIAAGIGTAGYSVAELRRQPEWVRHSADIVAGRALDLEAVPAHRPCHARPAGAGTLVVPRGAAIVVARRASPLFLRRFATEFAVPAGKLEPGKPVLLRIPADSARVPWRLSAPGAGAVAVCAT